MTVVLLLGMLLFAIFFIVYGTAHLIGGKKFANKYVMAPTKKTLKKIIVWFLKKLKRWLARVMTWLGRGVARVATRYPLPTGIVSIALVALSAILLIQFFI
ncbi:MAG TPA: hypothetical protein VI432_00470 [Candidatus Paceibacterota bacterium]